MRGARPPDPGAMRHRIEILKPAGGGWEPRARRWAAMKPLLGRELYAALSAESPVRVKFSMRHAPGVAPGDRIVCRGAAYTVVSAQDVDGRGAETVCYCKEEWK